MVDSDGGVGIGIGAARAVADKSENDYFFIFEDDYFFIFEENNAATASVTIK